MAIKSRLSCSSFSPEILQHFPLLILPDFASFWLHLAPNCWLCLPQANLKATPCPWMAALVYAIVKLPCSLRTVDLNHPSTCSTLGHSDGNFFLSLSSSDSWHPNCNPDLSSPSPPGIEGGGGTYHLLCYCEAAGYPIKESHTMRLGRKGTLFR